jgi:hypothetical protein
MRTPAWLRLSAEDVARAVYLLARHPRRAVVIPLMMRPFIWLNTFFPALLDIVLEWGFVRRERKLTRRGPE